MSDCLLLAGGVNLCGSQLHDGEWKQTASAARNDADWVRMQYSDVNSRSTHDVRYDVVRGARAT